MSAIANGPISARASNRALRYPLFDGAVSKEARAMLAQRDATAAMREYGRLAALRSGRARCVMAYAQLVGSFLTPQDPKVAKTLALSATASEPGFSKYILGFIALMDGNHAGSFDHFVVSTKAGLLPAYTASAKLFNDLYHSSEGDLRLAEDMFKRAAREEHLPAYPLLASFYARGSGGLIKRFAGLALYPISLIALYFAWSVGHSQCPPSLITQRIGIY